MLSSYPCSPWGQMEGRLLALSPPFHVKVFLVTLFSLCHQYILARFYRSLTRMSVLNMTQFPGYLSKDYLPLIQGPPFSSAQGPQGYSTSLAPPPSFEGIPVGV